MIDNPINDEECLAQLTRFARELYNTTWVRMVAAHLQTRDGVIECSRRLASTHRGAAPTAATPM